MRPGRFGSRVSKRCHLSEQIFGLLHYDDKIKTSHLNCIGNFSEI